MTHPLRWHPHVERRTARACRVGRQNLQFRIEVFNLFNRANFATPNSGQLFNTDGTRIPSATQITHTATTSRQVQFGLKFVF